MWRNSLLFLLIVAGLTASCSTAMEPSLSPASQSATPASPPSTPLHRAESPVPTPSPEDQPRADGGPAVPAAPAARARIDLARRLRVDSAQINVVNVTTRELDEAVISCLTKGAGSEKLWDELEEVQWITLAIEGKRYHYVALQDLTIYCGK